MKKFLKNDSGTAMVEFALISTILVLLLVGIVQLGLVFNAQLTLDYVAREGVRMAALPSTLTDNEIKTNMIGQLPQTINLQASQISITPSVRRRAQPVTVIINYNFPVFVTMGVLPESYSLSARVVMMKE